MKHIVHIPLLIAAVSLFALHAEAEVAGEKTFSIPGVIEIAYPANFIPASADHQEALDYAKRLLKKANATSELAFDQMVVLHAADYRQNGEYAHVNITLSPPEVTQEAFSVADAELIGKLKDLMSAQITQGFKKAGIELVGDFKGEKETLGNGINCFTLTFSYKQKGGSLRIDTKRYIYTKRHTLLIGITTSPGYSIANASELQKIVSSIKASND